MDIKGTGYEIVDWIGALLIVSNGMILWNRTVMKFVSIRDWEFFEFWKSILLHGECESEDNINVKSMQI